ncbi:MAG: sodium:calcium antiporter [Bacillota bacterium]|nr:sodium:calcium antiporter [Bacillota bacterium]
MQGLKRFLPVILAVLAALPWLVCRLLGLHFIPPVTAALSGMAILGAAFLLSWAAEVAQLEISAALAVAILALIAVLPEYSVDMYFAWMAGKDPTYTQYAAANMTGANRLLIGLGWSSVLLLYWWKTKRPVLHFERKDAVELGALVIATVYCSLLPIKGTLSLLDTVVLIAVFVMYIRATSKQGVEEPELIGPAEALSTLARRPRRTATVAMFLYAALAILVSAEPFAEGLVHTGTMLGIDEFFLVQWLAPLASEAPEFIVAALFALQGRGQLGVRAMISSKVNQWTLLIGMLPLCYAISSGSIHAMVLDHRQVQEVLLTVAQSAFAIAVLAKMDYTIGAAVALMVLFLSQLFTPHLHLFFSIVYLVLTVGLLIVQRQRLAGAVMAVGNILRPVPVAVEEKEGGALQPDQARLP